MNHTQCIKVLKQTNKETTTISTMRPLLVCRRKHDKGFNNLFVEDEFAYDFVKLVRIPQVYVVFSVRKFKISVDVNMG